MKNNPSAETDESVVNDIINGNLDAYSKIIMRYQDKLNRYVIFLIHNNEVAADVVQETFIKAFKYLRSFSPEYKFSSWIYRIAHNEAMNSVKKNQRLIYKDIETLPDLSYDQNLEELIDKKILKINVHECLNKLSPKYRDVVQLAYLENMKYDEISDVLRIPTSTVGVRISRAKSNLKKICTNQGVEQ